MRTASLLCFLVLVVACAAPAQPLYEGEAFTLTDTSVVQGDFRAEAPSRTRMTSTYQQEQTTVTFKFALNGRDNEFPSGTDRRIRIDPVDGRVLTPVYSFGEQRDEGIPTPSQVRERTEGDSVEVVFRVDLRPVLRSFRDSGRYVPPAGEPIEEASFEGVYIIGDTSPLQWSTDDLRDHERLKLTDPDDDGVYRTTLRFEKRDRRTVTDEGTAEWSLSTDVSSYPSYRSDQRLVDALYNLSLEEVQQNIRDDGALMAGAKWTGVWTRDISYSILLSLALLDPEAAKTSLREKVTEDGRIIQDTGTGGSWPVSTDRMTWALAAWEVYLTTGDEDWLRRSYDIIRRSATDDLKTAYDSTTGLFYGESSFLDWREQSYPDWMEPVDIYRSQVLSTNVVHYRTYRILGQMAEALGESSAQWRRTAEDVKEGINDHLWREDDGRYSAYRYGRTFLAETPRAEALGSALALLSGIPGEERAERVAHNHPVVEFGVPSFWPYIPGIPPYHNAGIWPFVGAYWTWASAEADNTPGVEHGLASTYRAAALFLTNKENMVAQTGHFEGTEINSDRQLWSVAGTLATVYRVFFGMRFTPDGLRFDPFVPSGYSGTHTLEDVPYRDATLDISMRGHGTRVVQATLDGEPLDEAVLPADLEGDHEVRLILNGNVPDGERRMTSNRYSPATPEVRRETNELQWDEVEDAYSYRIYRNGTPVDTTVRPRASVSDDSTLAEYQVQAIGDQGYLSFRSEPVRVVADTAVETVQPSDSLAAEHDGYTGDGYLVLTRETNREVTLEVTVPETGPYALDFRYANGHGPINTDNKAAIRSVRVDGRRLGAAVFPQRGDGAWTDWGYTNVLRTSLEAGTHEVTIAFTESDENMNGQVNAAHLDHLRITPLPRDDE
ncbi:MAG: MGH1-like glycoside hydrolase domain-containing protein [Salinivenus sp.]